MKILIATDGSDFSRAAVAECCRMIVRPENTEVMIVSAYEDAFPIMAEPWVVSGEFYQQVEDAGMEMATRFVDDARNMILDRFPKADLAVATEVLRGSPDQQIIEKAKEWKADLIVVGSHGRGFWGRLLGSVSTGVVHHAPCSVLVVRNQDKKD